MKSEALLLVENVRDPALKLNLLREYLQAFILRSLHESNAFDCLSFVGGTALRFLHGLPRFSEDLDFSLEQQQGYKIGLWLEKVKRDLSFAGFQVEVPPVNDRKTVQVAWVRTAELLQEAGLAALPQQKLSIKLEIDTRPPVGAALETTLVNRQFLAAPPGSVSVNRGLMFALRHHDLPSLLAGKIHAMSTREYLKGRDWYDLVWFRTLQTPRLEPNYVLLKNALQQTGANWSAEHWKEQVREKLDALDLKALRSDVAPFLERQADAELLTKESIQKFL
ncbi:MAG: nucleotidyl transferase AbiEii/AbiGii toxin family protein [Candidatus Firestonebacteria bacterium]|nr:nucleotidyl transferase AbiEii/AbiGii toxin family protein [Candidatus Firestonebacteria bacterium]